MAWVKAFDGTWLNLEHASVLFVDKNYLQNVTDYPYAAKIEFLADSENHCYIALAKTKEEAQQIIDEIIRLSLVKPVIVSKDYLQEEEIK